MSRCETCCWHQDLGTGHPLCSCGYERIVLADGEEYILVPLDCCPHWSGIDRKERRQREKAKAEAKHEQP